jgi:hypothetical protein
MNTAKKVDGFVSIPLVCIGGFALFLVVASSSMMLAKKGKQIQLPLVENSIQSFKLVSEEREDESILLRFKNYSNLTITGYTLSVGLERIGADFFPNTAVKGISPGMIEEVRIPLMNLSAQSQKRIVVLAVIFEDHTSEGDFQAARVIFERRRGYATQMRRITSLLFEAAQSGERVTSATVPTFLKQVKDKISSLPEQEGNTPSPGMRSGLNFAKQWTLKQIARLESGEMDSELERSQTFSKHATKWPAGKILTGLEWIANKADEIVRTL